MKFGRLQNGLLRSQPETAPSNFISNPTPLKDTTGWSLYSDAAGTAPVDGTGGSVNTGTEINWSRTTSSPLSETASFLFSKIATSSMQGKGVSYDFTINRADQAKVCRIDFDYEVASGTYADSDLTVWLYDVTNAQLIQPSASSILNAVGPQKKQPLSFQTNSNSTSYRLIIHVASTSASAYTVKFDNVSVTRESISQGTVVTDWVSYTPTFTGWSANVTSTGKWRRVGDTLEAEIKLALTGAPTGTLTSASLPSGLVIDTAKLSQTDSGQTYNSSGSVFDTSASKNWPMTVRYTSTTAVEPRVIAADEVIAYSGLINATQPVTFASGDTVTFNFRVPIVGWSSSQQLSSDADTRVVEFQATKITSTQNVSAGSATVVILNNIRKDSHGGFASNKYTVQVPGSYDFRYSLYVAMGATAATIVETWIRVNGGSVKYGYCYLSDLANTKTYTFSNFAQLELKARDEVEVIIQATTQSVTVGASPDDAAQFTGYKVGGPAQIAASEIVTGHYGGGTASVGNGVTSTLVMTTKIFDSHGSTYNTSTGVWTCPAPGKYQFIYQAIGGSDISATAVANNIQFGLTVDGAGEYGIAMDIACITSARRFNGRNTFILNLQAGQQVRFYASNGLGSGVTWTMLNNVNYSYFQWHRIGGVG